MISYIAPTIWNSLPNSLEATESLNTFKPKIIIQNFLTD